MKKRKKTARKKEKVFPVPVSVKIPPWLADIGIEEPQVPFGLPPEVEPDNIEKNSTAPEAIADESPMTQSEYYELLIEFYQSRMFQAYKRYTNMQIADIDNKLRILNPLVEAEATQMLRIQGARSALVTFEDNLADLLKKREEANQGRRVSGDMPVDN